MAAILSCLDADSRQLVAGMALASVIGAGVTAAASTAMKPLMGGALGLLSSLVSSIAIKVFEGMNPGDGTQFFNEGPQAFGYMAIEIGSTIVLALAAAAMGYAISIPVVLLLCATNTAFFFLGVLVCNE